MPAASNQQIRIVFLKILVRLKDGFIIKILRKKEEIKQFIAVYVFKERYGESLYMRICYTRLRFLTGHPVFKQAVTALLILPELSANKDEFEEHYQKATNQSPLLHKNYLAEIIPA